MKNIVRLMALVLTLVMVFSLVACGNSAGNNGETNVDSTNANTESKEEIKEFDMGGREMKVACWWAPMPSSEALVEEERLQYFQMEEAKKKYNFTIKEIVVDQRDIRVNFEASLMSGDIWADIIYMRAEQAIQWAKKGNLLDITNLYPHDSREYNQSMREMFTIDGKTYAFTYYEDHFENGLAFNKDIFDRVGLAYPYDLVKEGKWTWDKFVEYVQKATIRDVSTGKIDVYGYYAGAGLGHAEHLLYTTLGRQTIEIEDGKYVSKLQDPESVAFLNKVRNFYLMDSCYLPPSNVTTWSDRPVKFKAGRIAIIDFSMSGSPNGLKDAEFDWGVVPIPTMTEGQDYKFMNTTQNVQVMPAALAGDAEWAEQVAYVYHQIYKSPYTEEEAAAARRSTFETQLRDKESVEIVMEMTDKPVVLHNANMIGNDDYWSKISVPANKAFVGEDTIERAFASISDAHKAIVDTANQEF